jgi:hypothetical protein
MKHLIGLVVLVSMSAIALANDDSELGNYWSQLKGAKAETIDRISKGSDGAKCKAIVDKAKAAGTAGFKDSSYKQLSIDEAAKLCEEYDWHAKLRAHSAEWQRIFGDMRLLTPDMAPGPDFVKNDLALAQQCTKAADELLAAGVPPDLSFHPDRKLTMTVGEIKPKICDALTKAAGQFTKDMADVKKKAAERYTKVGIAGDKLDLMLKYEGSLFLAGGDAPDDMKRYAAASALFVWTTSDPDAADYVVHTVRKYSFSGNKLNGTSEKTYRKKRGEKLGGVFN